MPAPMWDYDGPRSPRRPNAAGQANPDHAGPTTHRRGSRAHRMPIPARTRDETSHGGDEAHGARLRGRRGRLPKRRLRRTLREAPGGEGRRDKVSAEAMAEGRVRRRRPVWVNERMDVTSSCHPTVVALAPARPVRYSMVPEERQRYIISSDFIRGGVSHG